MVVFTLCLVVSIVLPVGLALSSVLSTLYAVFFMNIISGEPVKLVSWSAGFCQQAYSVITKNITSRKDGKLEQQYPFLPITCSRCSRCSSGHYGERSSKIGLGDLD